MDQVKEVIDLESQYSTEGSTRHCLTDPMSPEYHSPLQQVGQDEKVIRAKQLQIAKLRVEMNLLRD